MEKETQVIFQSVTFPIVNFNHETAYVVFNKSPGGTLRDSIPSGLSQPSHYTGLSSNFTLSIANRIVQPLLASFSPAPVTPP
ncbi:hypothetical protein GWI33_023350 [Rhynchophorus ferrugineus]|uniref:Uncharacterized protein n=1 Tax=Rhynchophorus ferrugineus TaxID=354439 RepID=A0A834IR99_RHYFE|nr:hypothetical protein GWI33_023350 [Rhynchophorus ferrugineus]